jgi:flagellar motor switch protein FliG
MEDDLYSRMLDATWETLVEPVTKQSILAAAWSRYSVNYHSSTLGSCIRAECPVSYQQEHKVLSRLDGQVALEYFNDTFKEE